MLEVTLGFARGIVFGMRVFGLLYVALTARSGMWYVVG